ncbi:hypothetical protein [Nocardioides aurantiacus]|uniref:Uncharacterized protein n=1 Tax=Nocardioides aurantiacus TaxID=86796 RepID=A0A3N2CW27_9ACTN|nr:hypothetical protein [Nocardioides aurantiacus]ROR91689.1 hypothetical protein EDD33_2562 [Nocardioides aurantiacus]
MSIVVLPHLLTFLVGFAVLTGLALVLAAVALVATTPVVAQNRRTRLRRHEGVLHYYGHLALGH